MIIDKLDNIDLYINLPSEAINFIKNLKADIPEGKYILSDNAYANIETYNTKLLKDAKYESHNKYIDIQILLTGFEKIYYAQRGVLDNNVEYNSEKDITFYNESVGGNYVLLDGSNFVVIYPHEAHAPQICALNDKSFVKKVVVKIKI